MMKSKVIASLSIFSFLFAGAWVISMAEVSDFYIPGADNQSDVIQEDSIRPINEEFEADGKQKGSEFGPREYVKIKRIS
ncbi:hypothetical protein [Cytobacillus purgationiresistens]|uniref:Uncharacterized protein n=1 Tax=Cytobacillus purgationiresistens TaxID=863449 RepID=A0ABU0AJ42_9BACI|nr:hypothetical protein [Cytobacillus purgationiresistens]MDQ0270889.1 hypothetical protein [Cytobacillus purgationiresistens]